MFDEIAEPLCSVVPAFFLFASITMTTVITALKYPLNEIYTY